MRLLDKRQIEYSPLIEEFLKEIKDVNPNGIPEPHLPVIGENYFSSKTKIAFCGMETSASLSGSSTDCRNCRYMCRM